MLLSQRQREYATDISNAVHNAGGWTVSWPGSRRIRYEVLASHGYVADQLAATFKNCRLEVREIGIGERMTPDGPQPSLVFEVCLPPEKRQPTTTIHSGEIASTEVKAFRKLHGLRH